MVWILPDSTILGRSLALESTSIGSPKVIQVRRSAYARISPAVRGHRPVGEGDDRTLGLVDAVHRPSGDGSASLVARVSRRVAAREASARLTVRHRVRVDRTASRQRRRSLLFDLSFVIHSDRHSDPSVFRPVGGWGRLGLYAIDAKLDDGWHFDRRFFFRLGIIAQLVENCACGRSRRALN